VVVVVKIKLLKLLKWGVFVLCCIGLWFLFYCFAERSRIYGAPPLFGLIVSIVVLYCGFKWIPKLFELRKQK